MLAQAAGFALLAAIEPAAVLVMAVFLGSDKPRRTAMIYAAGAVLMTVVMAVTVLLVLRATGFNEPRHHQPRYGLRLGLGVLALAAAVVLTLRARRAPAATGAAAVPGTTGASGTAGTAGSTGKDATPRKPSVISRLTARPRAVTAFLAGLLVFAPSPAFIAAVQVIATAKVATPATVLAVAVVTVLTVLTVWLPLIAYLAAPEATTRALHKANTWLAVHGRSLVTCALLAAGVILVIDGALNL